MRSRVILTLCVATFLAVATTTAHAAPTLQQQYLDIYLKINDAQHLQQSGDFIGALDDFEDCYRKLAHIHDTNPEWETALVVHRMADCQKMIVDLRPKADAQVATRDAAQNAAPVPPPPVVTPPETNAPSPNPAPPSIQPAVTGSGDSDEVATLKLKLNAVTEELRITKEHLKESQAQLETYRVQLQTVNEQLDALKNQQSVDDKMGKLLSENKKLNDKLAEAQKELADLKSNPTSKLALAQKQLTNLQGEYEESQAANKALMDTTTTLKTQLDAAQADLVVANQKLASANASSPEYATLKRENEVMREILTRELQEQAHRDQAKRLAQEEFDNLKLKSKVLQEQLDILATPMTPATTDEERAIMASLKVPGPDVNTPMGNNLSASVTGNSPDTNVAAATPPAPSTPDTNAPAAVTPPATTPDTSANPPAVTIAGDSNAPSTSTNAPMPAPAPAPTTTASTPTPSTDSSATSTASSVGNSAAATDPSTPVPPSAPLGSMPLTVNSSTPASNSTGAIDPNAPTKSVLPPASTEIKDTTITQGANAQPAQNDPTQYSTKARLPDDMRDTAQDAADLFKNQKYDESAAKYQSIIDKYPESLYAWSNLGVVRFQQGKFDDALKALQQAVKLSPTDAFSYSNLGIVYYQLGQYENAIDALNSAKALDPNDAKTHNYLGCACSQKGWTEVAEKEFRKAIEIDPNFGDAHFNLALVYATSKPPSLELARREYNRALELGIAKDARLERLLGNTSTPSAAASGQ